MNPEVVHICNLVKAFPSINHALELYFLLNSDRKLWGCGKPISLPVAVTTTDYIKDDSQHVKTYSLRISQGNNAYVTLSEPRSGLPNVVMFSASIVDLQHMVQRLRKSVAEFVSTPWEQMFRLGGNLELWSNGVALSHEKRTEVIHSRLVHLALYSNSLPFSKFPSQRKRLIWRGPKEEKNNPPAIVPARSSIIQSSPQDPSPPTFQLPRSRAVSDSVENPEAPPSCTLAHENIGLLWNTVKTRQQQSSCSTMIRCLCTGHVNDIFKVQEFYDRIINAVGDVAMSRGSCPMCCISTWKRSQKPLVRFTEEVVRAEEDDHDWSDFQFRGMLFEMFPRNWVAVENKVYGNKNLALSHGVYRAFVLLQKRRRGLERGELGVKFVLISNLLRPWPLYEMSISRSHGEATRYLTLQYLDIAFGEVFRNQFKELFRYENPVLTRIMISAAQMLPGGNCLLDDSCASKPHSRSESHMVGCLVVYSSHGNRVLAEMLRTWDSIEWNGDIASYLKSIFQDDFCKGAFNYYFDSRRSTAVKVETFQGSLHVTSLKYNCDMKEARTAESCVNGVDAPRNVSH